MIAPEPPDQYNKFCSHLISKLLQPSLKSLHEQLKTEIDILKEEINQLNFQLSSIAMQRSTTTDVSRTVFYSTSYAIHQEFATLLL